MSACVCVCILRWLYLTYPRIDFAGGVLAAARAAQSAAEASALEWRNPRATGRSIDVCVCACVRRGVYILH